VDTNQLLIELLGHLQKADEARGVQEESLSDRNIVEEKSDDPAVESSEGRRKFGIIGEIFAEKFFEIQKKYTKDTALETSVQKITPKAVSDKTTQSKADNSGLKQLDKKWWVLVGSIAALLGGLFAEGPLKGTLKILAKTGFKIIKSMLLAKFKIFTFMAKRFITTFTNIFGDGILNGLKSMKQTAISKVSGLFKGGIMGKMAKFLLPALKFFKKVPLIGNIISMGFAISRFKNGDITGGVIDTLSALSGLLYPIAPPVALGLSIGLDVLNAVLDAKQSSPENAGKGKGEILWGMTKSLGKSIWKNAYNIPILGGIKRFMDAHELFKNGDYIKGFRKMGAGFISMTGLAPIATGMEMLIGLLENKNDKVDDLKPNKGWISSLKKWIFKKMNDLPWLFKKPLEWLGILDKTPDGDNENTQETKPRKSWTSALKKWISKKMDELPWVMKKPLEWLGILDKTVDDSNENTQETKPRKSWTSALKKWVFSKMEKLPFYLRKSLEWLGILDKTADDDSMSMNPEKSKNIKLTFSDILDTLALEMSSLKKDLSDSISRRVEKIKTVTSETIDMVWGGVSSFFGKISDNVKGFFKGSSKNIDQLDNVGRIDSDNKLQQASINLVNKNKQNSLNATFDDTLWGNISNKLKNFFNFENSLNTTKSPQDVNSIRKDTGNTLLSDISNKLKNFFNFENSLNTTKSPKDVNSIPKNKGEFAANVEKNTPRLVGEIKNMPIGVSSDINLQGLTDVVGINNDQLSVLQDLRNISIQTLKVLAKNKEQVAFIPSSTPIRNRSSSNNSDNKSSSSNLNVSRGDYGSSPYALV
jgi:hypothetical protein